MWVRRGDSNEYPQHIFYGEKRKIIPKLSWNTHLICFSGIFVLVLLSTPNRWLVPLCICLQNWWKGISELRLLMLHSIIYRGSYMSGQLIWKWNELCTFYATSFINFILNNCECKILFIIWPVQRSKSLKITQLRLSITVCTNCCQWFCSITQGI